MLQNKAEFIDRCFDTVIQAAQEPTEEDRGPYSDFSEKMMKILKLVTLGLCCTHLPYSLLSYT